MDSKLIRKKLSDLINNWESIDDFKFIKPNGIRFQELLTSLHSCNYYQWLLEDEVRKKLSCEHLIIIKREIDVSNFARNKYMESIDELIVKKYNINQNSDFSKKYLNSETIGQLLDRLSILLLKSFFINLSNGIKIDNKLQQIENQISFTSYCFDKFLNKIESGEAFMLSYKQYKTYNKSKI